MADSRANIIFFNLSILQIFICLYETREWSIITQTRLLGTAQQRKACQFSKSLKVEFRIMYWPVTAVKIKKQHKIRSNLHLFHDICINFKKSNKSKN